MVTFVMKGEPTAAIVTLYGGTPPLMLIPQGSQVSRVPSVMFEEIVNSGFVGSGTTHAVLRPSVVRGQAD